MPNVIKYSTGATPTGCLRKGNMLIGNNTADYGLTFFNGIDPPAGGYTIYLNKASGGPSIYCPANDTQLIAITNQIAGANYTTAAQCLAYFAGQTDKIILNKNYEPIVTDGLVLYLDADQLMSYPTTGSTWYDISGRNTTGTLYNSPTFNDNGWFEMDGTDDIIYGWQGTLPTPTYSCSLDMVVNIITSSFWGELFYIGASGFNHNMPYVAFYLDTYGVPQLTFGTNETAAGYRGIHDVATTITGSFNKWAHIVGTMQDDELEMFINGESKGTYTLPTGWTSSLGNENVYLGGGLSTGFVSDVNCKIQSAKVYNRGLTPYEVYQNYITTLNSNMVTDGERFITSWVVLAGLTSRTPNAVQAPDGSMTATLFERISVANPGHAQIRQNFPVIDLFPDTTYNVSFWAKRIYLTQRLDFEFSDTPQQVVYLTDEWKFYSFSLTTNSTFPVGEFIDIGSTTVSAGSQLGEQYSMWNLHVSLAQV